jgi:hypothetical protein
MIFRKKHESILGITPRTDKEQRLLVKIRQRRRAIDDVVHALRQSVRDQRRTN